MIPARFSTYRFFHCVQSEKWYGGQKKQQQEEEEEGVDINRETNVKGSIFLFSLHGTGKVYCSMWTLSAWEHVEKAEDIPDHTGLKIWLHRDVTSSGLTTHWWNCIQKEFEVIYLTEEGINSASVDTRTWAGKKKTWPCHTQKVSTHTIVGNLLADKAVR